LFRNLLHQNVQMQVQKYVVKNHHQKRYLRIQMMIPMVTGIVMLAVMGVEKTDQMVMETVTIKEDLMIIMVIPLVATPSLIDVNDRENFLLDIIAVVYL
jgi:hypothetical protein